jgi:hypothetical protein
VHIRAVLIGVVIAAALVAVPSVGAVRSVPSGAKQAGFLTGPRTGAPFKIALNYVRTHKAQLGLRAGDLRDFVVTDRYRDSHNGVTHVYLKQRYHGIDVYGADLSVNVARDGSVINVGNRFVSNLADAVTDHPTELTARESVGAAARKLKLGVPRGLSVKEVAGGAAKAVTLSKGGISTRPIDARLVYVPRPSGVVRLAWLSKIYEPGDQHWWDVTIDAQTGAMLTRADKVSEAGYNVFALPKESPYDGGRTLVTDPQNALASPFGWHDTDGAPGAESTLTIGNNVHAATDLDANDVPDAGSEPDGGAGLLFDFALDLTTQEPAAYRSAAVTNLFYFNNIIHDVTYQYGFDEASGNFQTNNYGRGGLGGDLVFADAQDGSGLNNANFGTDPDGLPARMQMYVWRASSAVVIGANSYFAVPAAFGPELTTTGITGQIEVVNDGVAPGSDACQPLAAGSLTGKVAMIDRGTCSFAPKVKNAEDAGAAAVIMVNNVPGPPITMGNTIPPVTVTIPSAMISLADGNTIKPTLPTNGTLRRTMLNRDSDLDNGVIAHEYMHGISNRLTGGPANVSCLQTTLDPEQMGEGWSDFLALVMTAKASEQRPATRGIGTYVNFNPPGGVGIRPTQYSTDMTVDPATYDTIKDTVNISAPHGVGYVWASMLWEVYWNLVDVYGFNSDLYDGWETGGNNLALQLVMDGLKLQPCLPGFVDGRDAILDADAALTGGQNQCAIWRGFAKRGLGASASQGSTTSRTDGTQAFDVPAGACYAFAGFFGGIKNPPTLNKKKAGSIVPTVFSLGGNQGLDIFAKDYPKSREIDCTTKAPIGPDESTVSPGGSALTYDAASDRYTYQWQTKQTWAGTCRELVVRLDDSTEHVAYVQFTK